MPAELKDLIDNYHPLLIQGLMEIYDGGQALYVASSWLAAHDYVTASGFIQLAGTKIKDGAYHCTTPHPWPGSGYYRRDMLYWINDNWPDGAGVDMDAIVNAMLTATPSQFQHFIGIVDAYRVALWNAPFNSEFYAALARGFTQWA